MWISPTHFIPIRFVNIKHNILFYASHQIITESFLFLCQQVSTSCNESKDEITLDEVREKFFDLCSRSSVAVEESDNN